MRLGHAKEINVACIGHFCQSPIPWTGYEIGAELPITGAGIANGESSGSSRRTAPVAARLQLRGAIGVNTGSPLSNAPSPSIRSRILCQT